MLRRALARVVVGSPVCRGMAAVAATGGEVSARASDLAMAPALTAVAPRPSSAGTCDRGGFGFAALVHPPGGGWKLKLGGGAAGALGGGGGGGGNAVRGEWSGGGGWSGASAAAALTARAVGGPSAAAPSGVGGISHPSFMRASIASYGASSGGAGGGGGGAGRWGRPARSTSKKQQDKDKSFRNQEKAIVHVSSLMNNTFVTLTTLEGDTLAWASGGTQGFKGSRRATAYAAQLCGETIGKACVSRKLFIVAAKIKGPGYGKESSLRGLKSAGVKVIKIQDVSTTPHNGCRPKKKRRV